MSSVTPVSVTVCAVFQFAVVKVSAVVAAGAPAPEDTLPSPESPLDTSTVTVAVGSLASFTVKVAAAPSAAVIHVSFTSAGSAGSSTRAARSSSRISSSATTVGFPSESVAAATWLAVPATAADTTTFLPVTVPSTMESTSSSTAVIVTTPVLAVSPAAMVSVLLAESVKSSAAPLVPAAA